MSYDQPFASVSYDFGVIDFGTASDILKTIEVPVRPGQTTGMAGRVKRVRLGTVTEDFAGSSSDAGVRVGDGSDDDKYYDTGLVLDETTDVADLAFLDLEDDGAKVDIEKGRTTITVTFVANAGTPTGQAEVFVDIDWF